MSADAFVMRASIALMAVAAVRLIFFSPDVGASAVAPVRAGAQSVSFEEGAPGDLVSQILARALFDPARRRADEPKETERDEGTKSDSLALVGVVITPRLSEALIAEGSGRPKRAGLDEKINGWTIVSIEPRSVTLNNGATRRVLTLRRSTPAAKEEESDEP